MTDKPYSYAEYSEIEKRQARANIQHALARGAAVEFVKEQIKLLELLAQDIKDKPGEYAGITAIIAEFNTLLTTAKGDESHAR